MKGNGKRYQGIYLMVLYHFHAKNSKKIFGRSNFWRMLLVPKKSCTDLLCLVDKLLLLLSLCLFNIKFLTISLQQYNNNIQQEIVQDKRNGGVTPSVAKSRRSKRSRKLKKKFYFNKHWCVMFFSCKATLGLLLSVCPSVKAS